MKILTISDIESDRYYNYYRPGKFDGIALILSAGDLKKGYLDFIVTMSGKPLVYVLGNHDQELLKDPPGGCLCAEDKIVVVNGIRILGLGGSYRYNGGECMYTEGEMRYRVRKLWLQLRKYGGFDILLAHAPARGLNDTDALSHRGFECFRELMDKYHPKYFIHGHVHMNYGMDIPRSAQYGETTVINAWGDHVIEY